MDRSCGNCAMTLRESERLVQCQPDLLPAVWHRKTDVCRLCSYFKPRFEELHLRMTELRVEYYLGENKVPIAVIVRCQDGRRFVDQFGRIGQVRKAGWRKTDEFYCENGIRYRREVWRPGGGGAEQAAGLPVVVSTGFEIGPCRGRG